MLALLHAWKQMLGYHPHVHCPVSGGGMSLDGAQSAGGAVRFPPTIWKARALVASGDGCVYAFEAATGKALWRFRAAPEDRKIAVYGTLQSTWPVASGVVVEDAVAYVADSCWDDMVEHCGDVQMGEGRVATCLLDHKEDVSETCRQAMDDVELEVVDE